MEELLLIFVAKHRKDKYTIEVTETPALLHIECVYVCMLGRRDKANNV